MNTLRSDGNHSGNTFPLSSSYCLLPGFYVPVSCLMLKHQQDERSGPSGNAGMASGPTCLCVGHYWSDFQFHPFWAKLRLIAHDNLSSRDDGTLVIHWSIRGPWARLKHKIELQNLPSKSSHSSGSKRQENNIQNKELSRVKSKELPLKGAGEDGHK